jgi:hypothetical protein
LAKLPKAQAFRFFRELVNYDEAVIDAATLRYDTHVDYFVSIQPWSATETTCKSVVGTSRCSR